MALAYRLVYSSVEPSGALIWASTTPRSSIGDNSRLISPSTAQLTQPLPTITTNTSQRWRNVQFNTWP